MSNNKLVAYSPFNVNKVTDHLFLKKTNFGKVNLYFYIIIKQLINKE